MVYRNWSILIASYYTKLIGLWEPSDDHSFKDIVQVIFVKHGIKCFYFYQVLPFVYVDMIKKKTIYRLTGFSIGNKKGHETENRTFESISFLI